MNRHIKSFLFYFVICYALTTIGFIYINVFLWSVSEGFAENARLLLSVQACSFAVLFIPSTLYALFGTLLNTVFAKAKLPLKIILNGLIIIFSIYLAIPFTAPLFYIYLYITQPSLLMDVSLVRHINYVISEIQNYMHPVGFAILCLEIFYSLPIKIILIIGNIVSFFTLRYGSKKFSKPLI